MKKVLFSFLVLVCLQAQGQLKGFGIGPYAERAWPAGNMENRFGNGLGAGLSADIKLPGRLSLTGSAGVLHFGGKTYHGEAGAVQQGALTAVPVRAGLKYRLPLVYLKLESGTARMNRDMGTSLIVSPGVGIRVLGLDVQAKYENWTGSDVSFWGLRMAYQF